MPRITFEGAVYESTGGSVLDCLGRQGVQIPSACRAGVCQSCLMQARDGPVPARAQEGLTATMVARKLFLACQCVPEHDIEIARAVGALVTLAAQVLSVARLAPDVVALRLAPAGPYAYRAGQFLRLYRDPQTARNYSLASVPGADPILELHIRRIAGGAVSGWVFEHLAPGDPVIISEASGNCFYVPGKPEQNLLLLATGTGVAPLAAIARDALRCGHQGQIRLYHGSPTAAGAYLEPALQSLAARHPQFSYRHCVSEGEPAPGQFAGTPPQVALRDQPDLAGWRVYLCGNPGMVDAARIDVFLAGAASGQIHADPFVASAGDPVAAAA